MPFSWSAMPFFCAPCLFFWPIVAFFLYKNCPFSWCETPFSFVTSGRPRFLSVLINMWTDYVRNLHLFTEKKTFCGFAMGRNQYRAGRVYDLCVYYMTGTPEGSTESFFFFCGFSMGRNQYWAGRVYDLCVYYMTGTPEGSTESGFMEKPGIEPATPGLQGIALIHYTTGVLKKKQNFLWLFHG